MQAVLRSHSTFSSSSSDSSFTSVSRIAAAATSGPASDILSGLRHRLESSLAPAAALTPQQAHQCSLPATFPLAISPPKKLPSPTKDQTLVLDHRLAIPSLISDPSAGGSAEEAHSTPAGVEHPVGAGQNSYKDSLAVADAGPAILVTNDLFQQLPDECNLPRPASNYNAWQVNDIFETQASTTGSDSREAVLSAGSDQYSSLDLTSSGFEHSPPCLAGPAQPWHLDTGSYHQHSDDDAASSHVVLDADVGQHSQHKQAFSELFDTQLSQFSTHEDMLGSSAKQAAVSASSGSSTASAHSSTDEQHQHQAQSGSLTPCVSQVHGAVCTAELLPVCRHTTDTSSNSVLGSEHSTVSAGASCASQVAVQYVYQTSLQSPSEGAADTAAILLDSTTVSNGCTTLGEREPLAAAVSTAQLEVMGWDMFADTLATCCLFSDSDSDAESTDTLLPEPSELGPITPEGGVPQARLLFARSEESGLDAVSHANTALGQSGSYSERFTQVELLDSSEEAGGSSVTAGECVTDNCTSPLDWDYHGLGERQGLTEAYPGMISDAEEFDGHGTGCLGQQTSCLGRIEQCMTCYPCATCACYPHDALRPGKRLRKSRLRRAWASIRAKGSACVHPTLAHERYT